MVAAPRLCPRNGHRAAPQMAMIAMMPMMAMTPMMMPRVTIVAITSVIETGRAAATLPPHGRAGNLFYKSEIYKFGLSKPGFQARVTK